MNSGNTVIINQFFSNNYYTLVQKCRDYSQVYNYREMQPDEIISELYLYTLDSVERTNKLTELIALTAATINKVYQYSHKAHYYIHKIVYNITKDQRSFYNSCNRNPMQLKYIDDLKELEVNDEEYQELFDYNDHQLIYRTAEELEKLPDNWWKYKIWYDYYKNKLTYKELSQKYKLTITPLFYVVRGYNEQIKNKLGV